MNSVFKYEGNEVRTVIIEGEPWFVAKDVCAVLEITNSTVAMKRLDVEEVAKFNLGGLQGTVNVINESGLYSLILGSRKPEARAFKRWITREVLPSIRKTGGYVNNDELFVNTYLPFADDTTKQLFRSTRIKSREWRILYVRPRV
ncbi:Uncharacterized phage-encoded protein [Chlamydia abortus]|nr:Uncharacterized phage-encoded protein [Chlamydia abortus]